jgi:hypothetical protein
MVVHHVRKPINLVFYLRLGGCCSEYLATATFVEEVNNLFDNFNGGMCFDLGKTLRCPFSDNSPHINGKRQV